ncbi:glucan endo-1,3-beta-glucosidase-like protein [Tanacetum coccineum]
MASNLLLLSILILKLLIFTDAQSVGVCYGQIGNGLPSEQDVVNLYQRNGINRMRMYGPNPAALQALSGTNIDFILDVPNSSLEALADQNAAAVTSPAMPECPKKPNNDAGRQIKVSTATYTGQLQTTYPPSEGAFRDNVVGYIEPIIRFLKENNSPMLANIYPYFAYIGAPNDIELSYALFTKPDTGDQYKNLFDAMYDAHLAAQRRLGGADVPIVVSESGWPSAGGNGATMENAGTYYRNLIAHVKRRSIETYLFAMFDEDQKPGEESEKHFGLWDLTAGKLLHEFKYHQGQVQCIDFHPHEFLMATGSADKTVKFWDLETLKLMGLMAGQSSSLLISIAYDPLKNFEGRWLWASKPHGIQKMKKFVDDSLLRLERIPDILELMRLIAQVNKILRVGMFRCPVQLTPTLLRVFPKN